jgi:predicted nuclease of predicted toxin-antitoxin system
VKFYLDENLSPVIAESLRGRGLDATSAHEVGMAGAPDEVQLAFASSQGRCLVTCDLRHFIEHGRRAVRDRRPHAGIILCPASLAAEVGAIARALARVAEHYPAGFGQYDIIYLTRGPAR